MTMPFTVNDAALLEGKQPGDLVTATLVVGETDAYLSTLTRTGTAPLDGAERGHGGQTRAILMPGDAVPDQLLVDQNGDAARRSRRCAATAWR